MRMIVILVALGLAAASALSASPVLAADPGQVEPVPPAPVTAAPAYNWSGYTIGALLGYSFGEASESSDSADIEGFDGGVYIGANYQWNQFVLGVEADALISGVDGSAGGIGVDQNWSASLRARAGIALDQFLLYGTGGVAVAGAEVSDATSSDANTHWGWTLGAGAEALVMGNVTARVEYRYADYEDKTYTLDSGTGDVDLKAHSVRAGVGLKF